MTKQKLTERERLHDEFTAQADALNLHIDVISDGPINSEVIIIGEGLGETEVRTGVPFSGGSGRLLWDGLRKHGLHRANCYVTNVVKRQISLSRKGNERHVVHRDELQRWQGLLQWELSQLPNARIILCLGNYALEAITGNTGITNWRGSVLEVEAPQGTSVKKVVCTINPAYALRELKMEPMFLMDLHKLHLVHSNTFKVHSVEALINPTFKEAMDFIRALSSSKKPISFDVEVVNMETACFGLGNSAHNAMCIALRDNARNRYTVQEEADLLLALQKLCDSHKVIAQNGSFDAYWTRLKDYLCVTTWFDTLLAHHTLYPQLPHSLAFLTGQYTTHPYYKDEGKFWREGGDIDQFWRYNCTDVALTYAIHERLQRELKEQGLEDFFFNHVMRAQPHLVSATVHGVAVDVKAKEQITRSVGEDVEALRARFYTQVHEATRDKQYFPNPDSWQQLATLFYDRLHLKGRGRGTDEASRNALIAAPTTNALCKELLTTLNSYKAENKFYGTYATRKLGEDNRDRCEYKQYGVARAPGRLSSAQLLTGEGGNMQNIPVKGRHVYIADPGCVFVYFDLAQAEARIVAWRANITKWKEQFEQARIDGKYDAHRALASEMFKVPYEDVPYKDHDADHKPTIRYIAKRCFTKDAEVLTPCGWIPIYKAYSKPIEIATYEESGQIKWEVPSDWFCAMNRGSVVSISGQYFQQTVTPDHKMPVFNNGILGARPAKDLLNKTYGAVPICGILQGGYEYPLSRIRAMAWADGTIEPAYHNSVRVSVKKDRKAERIRKLASESGLRLWEGQSGGMYHFRLYGVHEKALDWSMIHWNQTSRAAFLDELLEWDGHRASRRVFNTDLEGMKIIQTLAHLSGMRASIFNHGMPRGNEKQCYVLTLKANPMADYESMDVCESQYYDYVYCPTVSTGWILIRENGKISVSGQCRHGLNYRMERFKLAEVTGLPYHDASKAFALYHGATPELKRWWDRTESDFRKHRVMYNALGRRWRVIQRLNDEVMDSIIAFYPQSTVGDKITQVWYQAEEDDDWPIDARVCIDVHDNLVALASPKTAKTALAILKKYAESPIYVQDVWNNKPEPVIIPAELKMSTLERYTTLKNGKVKRIADDVYHRWSNMKVVEL